MSAPTFVKKNFVLIVGLTLPVLLIVSFMIAANLPERIGAAALCSTSAARELGLSTLGAIERDATADLVVLDRDFNVLRTFVDGQQVFPRTRADND